MPEWNGYLKSIGDNARSTQLWIPAIGSFRASVRRWGQCCKRDNQAGSYKSPSGQRSYVADRKLETKTLGDFSGPVQRTRHRCRKWRLPPPQIYTFSVSGQHLSIQLQVRFQSNARMRALRNSWVMLGIDGLDLFLRQPLSNLCLPHLVA
jgi:hypothetical protein